ncbi:ABC transporter permease [Oceaniglobus trochenteri]|uniref:ABC transporter permease n=1 Tax=Oceaniglobus trochenteri TaxID=2763260 RepID=UPI001CFFF0BF|nr:ABC transporter permease [Oceaniglobus trochenteri]
MTDASPAAPAITSPGRAILHRFFTSPLGVTGATILGVLIFCAILAPFIAPHDPTEIFWDHIQQPPSATFLFGTDELGRDILSRVIWGARVSLWVVICSIGIALLIGSLIGLISGYVGGVVDDVIMRINDAILAFPMLILALGIIAVFGPTLTNAILAIAVVNIPGFARVVRGQVLSVREHEFVEAARSIGLGPAAILLRHILPYVSGNVIVYASLRASAALITESALAFLGLGVKPPTPTWGSMLATAMQYWDAWWMSIFPGLAIFIAVLGLNFTGDALLDAKQATESDN